MSLYDIKPKSRSKIRVFIGKRYYRSLRYLKWIFDGNQYTSSIVATKLEHPIFEYSTPIYRKLKDVDMWLQENKAHNLGIAIDKINGLVIRPGESFSYWKSIGKPTKSKGYKDGMVLYYGKFETGTGGGLCQLSNLLYWMSLHTPLTVTERYRHSYDVFPDSNRTQPFGSGATCVYNYRDLVIKNETHETYQINLNIEEGWLKGQICSDAEPYFRYEIYEASHEMKHEFWGAYTRHNEIRRKVQDLKGEDLGDEHVCENHALMMYEPFLENRT